ncbi:hypothetical protein QTH87_03590 [Variovorax sp. J22P168]|uniref:hypothetical protein n=1 Tax=Variovorax jilinensis TaxID=3053513 RepID=UPI00257573D0|nr:hypothetical protein [Variovorax sp. J22P168]MDM0011515.1 hypothetical protein [Variovorax sp. J22P168]
MARHHATFHRLAGLALLSICGAAAASAAGTNIGTIHFAGTIVAPPHALVLAPAASHSSDSASAAGVHVHFSAGLGQSAHVHADGVDGLEIGMRCIELRHTAAGGCVLDSNGGTISIAALALPGDGARRAAILTVAYD